MTNLTLSDALEEAYASADPDVPIIPTISIYFDGLVDDDDNPADVFLFDGMNPTRINDDGSREFDAALEVTAPRRPGARVTFSAVPFSISIPDTTTDPLPRATLSIDNVSRDTIDLLVQAAQSGKAIYVTYREYLVGGENGGPENDPPLVFNLVEVTASGVSVSGKLLTLTIGSRRFPWQSYSALRFPTLQYA
jgi:hypothetical protein